MAIKIGDNFLYRGKKPLDSRDSFDTILAMTTFAESSIDEGHISYVKETDKYYKFNSTNDVDTTLGKWREYNGGGGSSTDEKVKLDATATDAKYLNELIDNATIEVDTTNNCLVVKKIDGQTATVAEINFLTGIKSNIQAQIDNLGKSMTMYGVFGTKADLLASATPTPVDGNTAIVIADEDNDNKQMTYIYIASNSAWTPVAESSVTVRDFTTDPIDLATETTGILHKSKIDTAIARLADVLDKTTYRGTGDGIVKQADKLTGLTATIAALNQAVTDSHTHSNKTVLDKIVSNGIGSGFLADNGKYISILHVGNTSPTYDSQIWIDNTDSSKPILKIFDGTNWVSVSGSSSGSGTSITIDTAMSSTSTNPVQNKVIKAYVDSKSVDISADLDNAIQNKTDGIYVEKTKISTDDGNALSKKSNGLFVEDKTDAIKAVDDKVNSISKYQKYVNTELDSCFCKVLSPYTPVEGEVVPFISVSGNMENTEGKIKLNSGERVQVIGNINYYNKNSNSNANIVYALKDITNNIEICTYQPYSSPSDTKNEFSYSFTAQYENSTNSDCEIGLVVKNVYVSDTVFTTSNMTIQEIGRAITIDPVEYVNTTQGIEDTPVGSVISYSGINIPKHYLPCDGRIYNITDYPHLAEFFKDNYGDASVSGGDGTTTFGVPTRDVRINKIDLVPEMASNSQDGYVLTSSSIYSADYTPYQAFDKNKHPIDDSSFATANGTTTGWIQIEFPQKERVTEFSLQARAAGPASNRTSFIDFQLLGSNDGTNFNTLFSITDEPAWYAGEIREYELTSKNRYKYYRLNVSKSSGTPYVDIQEIGLFKITKEQYIIKAEPTYYMNLEGVEVTEDLLTDKSFDIKTNGVTTIDKSFTLPTPITDFDEIETVYSYEKAKAVVKDSVSGTVATATELTPTSDYKGINFPGTSTSGITYSTIPGLTYPLTVEIAFSTSTNGQFVFVHDVGLNLTIGITGNHVQLATTTHASITNMAYNISSWNLVDGNFHTITVTYNSADSANLYFDGVLKPSITHSSTWTMTNISSIGNRFNSPYDGAFKGTLYAVRFYNGILSQSDIVASYNSDKDYVLNNIAQIARNNLACEYKLYDSVEIIHPYITSSKLSVRDIEYNSVLSVDKSVQNVTNNKAASTELQYTFIDKNNVKFLNVSNHYNSYLPGSKFGIRRLTGIKKISKQVDK